MEVQEDDGLGFPELQDEEEVAEAGKEEEEDEKENLSITDQDKTKLHLVAREVMFYTKAMCMQLLRHVQHLEETMLHNPDILCWIQQQEIHPKFQKAVRLKEQYKERQSKGEPRNDSKEKTQVRLATKAFTSHLVSNLQELSLQTMFNAALFLKRTFPFPVSKLKNPVQQWINLELTKRKKSGMVVNPPPLASTLASSSSASAQPRSLSPSLTTFDEDLEQKLLASWLPPREQVSISPTIISTPASAAASASTSASTSSTSSSKITPRPPVSKFNTDMDVKHSAPLPPSYLNEKQKQQIQAIVSNQKKRRRKSTLELESQDHDEQDADANSNFQATRRFTQERTLRAKIVIQRPLTLAEQNQPRPRTFLDVEAQVDE
jgi:hypothetical protein